MHPDIFIADWRKVDLNHNYVLENLWNVPALRKIKLEILRTPDKKNVAMFGILFDKSCVMTMFSCAT